MQKITVEILLLVLLAVACTATYNNNRKKDGAPCYPRTRKPCGEKTASSTTYQSYPRGVNVCKKVTLYKKHFYRYVYQKRCSGYWYRRCNYYCTQTDSCDYVKTFTQYKYTCCPGYTTAPSPTDYHHARYSNSLYYLKKFGCPREIRNSTLQCIADLELLEFFDLISGTSLENTLNGDDKFTLFVPTNEILMANNFTQLNLSESQLIKIVGSHIVRNVKLASKLYDGQIIPSLVTGKNIHVTEIELKKYKKPGYYYYEKIFINGQELISRDACVATNGIVHIIDGVIDSSNYTIRQVIESSTSLHNLTDLFTAANLLGLLDRSCPLLTLFAPTDAGIATLSSNLGIDIVSCLTSPENIKELKHFLLYHLVKGAEYSASLSMRSKVVTKSCTRKKYHFYRYYRYKYSYYKVCKKLPLSIGNFGLQVGNATITHLDIPASNGVVHYISQPLVNPCLNLAETCQNHVIKRALVIPPPLIPPPP